MHWFNRRPQGLSGVTQLFLLLLIGIFGYVLVKLVPYYYENFLVSVSLKKLKEDYALGTVGAHEVKEKLMRQFDIDSVDIVSEKDIKVRIKGRDSSVVISYEVVVPLLGNVNALLTFTESAELNAP